ncbi:MAG: glycosyltransferase family 2 protein [Gemmatimonadetes bacterium]|nr:glycosyltransferase family 2 protein [Gemmatimonadota bacterium]
MQPAPLVSIVLPTYNRMPYLAQAVESVLRQTEGRWELLLVDDGSNDGTTSYLGRLDDARIHVLRRSHIGHPGAVRNVALPLARGRYVAFLDSDDWWEPEKLSLQLAALADHPECGWSYTWFRSVDQDGREIPSHRPSTSHEGMIVESLITGEAGVITSSMMLGRAVLTQIDNFDESLIVASHFDLLVRLAMRSSVVLVPRVLTTRRTHAGNYGRPFRESPVDIERVFGRLLDHVPSTGLRRLVRDRRTRWWIETAERLRHERRYREARNALRAALPAGLRLGVWWVAAVKVLVSFGTRR